MFDKKKIYNMYLEDEVEVATSNTEVVEVKEEIKEVEVMQEIKIVEISDEETKEFIAGNYTFHDSDPNNECSVDEDESKEVIEVKMEKVIDKGNRKDLSLYFEASKKDNSKIIIKEEKKSKRQQIKEEELLGIKNQKIFVFRNKKYTEVEDFIEYLNNHYQEIDKISKEVLDDEKFYTWLSKNSDVFDDSIKQFKDIKEKIEKK